MIDFDNQIIGRLFIISNTGEVDWDSSGKKPDIIVWRSIIW